MVEFLNNISQVVDAHGGGEMLHLLGEYKKALDESNIVSKSDLDGNITYVNGNFCAVTGYTKEEVIGRPHGMLRHSDTPRETFEHLWQTIKSKQVWKGILKNRKKDGGYYWVDMSIVPILNSSKEIVEYIAIRHDITELIDQREELEKIVQTDPLTGIGNRFKLINDIKTAQKPAIALINIDNFREINDFYGNQTGDYVIVELANKIFDYTQRQRCKMYRLHADEYALLVDGWAKEKLIALVDDCMEWIGGEHLQIGNQEIDLLLTASLSFVGKKERLMVTADMAMRSAKKSRKNLLVFDETLSINKEYERNIQWSSRLKKAMQEERIVSFFQPIVNNENGKTEKYECLVRMIGEDGEIIGPDLFLEIAKRSQFYTYLTKIMISKSFDVFSTIDAEFSVNLTVKDIMNQELMVFLDQMIDRYDISDKLVFEIVESEGIDNYELVIGFIERMKQKGCKIAIDDFGSGYSNFEYLLRLKADYIKIDGSMIKNIDSDENSKIIVSTIVGFAKKMGIKTIAEFVKDAAVYEIVKALGVDYSQGYYLGKPSDTPKFVLGR